MNEEEVETVLCPNCHHDIPSRNITMHTVHCQKNLILCSKCKTSLRKDDYQKHLEKKHVIVPCPECGNKMEKYLLGTHKLDECPKRKVACKFCELDLPVDKMPEHENYCGSRTEKCSDCGEFVMLKYRTLHLDSNHGFLKLQEENSTPRENPVHTDFLKPTLQRETPSKNSNASRNRPTSPKVEKSFKQMSLDSNSKKIKNKPQAKVPASTQTGMLKPKVETFVPRTFSLEPRENGAASSTHLIPRISPRLETQGRLGASSPFGSLVNDRGFINLNSPSRGNRNKESSSTSSSTNHRRSIAENTTQWRENKNKGSSSTSPSVNYDNESFARRLERTLTNTPERPSFNFTLPSMTTSPQRKRTLPVERTRTTTTTSYEEEAGFPSYTNNSNLDGVSLPCEFCEELIPEENLILHQTGCRPDLVCRKVAPLLPCEFCNNNYPAGSLLNHQTLCATTQGRCCRPYGGLHGPPPCPKEITQEISRSYAA